MRKGAKMASGHVRLAIAVAIAIAFLLPGIPLMTAGTSSTVGDPPRGTSATWTKLGVVLDVGGTGESTHLTCPSVLRLPNGTYAMYYTATGGSGYRIFRAFSTNGLSWTKEGMVLDYGGIYATNSVLYPYVMLAPDGSYNMWYAGQSFEGGNRQRVLRATSATGLDFQYVGLEMNYGGADGPASVTTPFVLEDGGALRLYYQGTTWNPALNSWINLAHKNNITEPWVKDGITLDTRTPSDHYGSSRAWVIKGDNDYEMFYTTDAVDGVWRICHATSSDGLCWVRDGIVIEPTLPQEASGTRFSTVLKDGETYRMWYAACDGTNTRIMYAETTPESAPPAVDLSISSSDIALSNESPVASAPVTISATVHGDETIWGSEGQQALVFSDDFESGSLSKWGVTQWNPCGVLEVTTAQSSSPPYSMHAQSNPGTNTGPYVYKKLPASYDHVALESSFYLPAKAQAIDFWIVLSAGNWSKTHAWDSGSNYEFYLVFDNDNYKLDILEIVKGDDGTWDFYWGPYDFYELTPASWHDIQLEMDASSYALFVDGSEVISGERQAQTLLNAIVLGDIGGAGGGWGDAYWDDVEVWAVTDVPTVVHEGLDASCDVSFYLDSAVPANLIEIVEGVFVPADGQTTVSVDWMAVAGEHEIIVQVDDVAPPESDWSDNTASRAIVVAQPQPAALSISKVKLSGISEGFTDTYYEWELLITIENTGGSLATDVLVQDVLPAELGLLEISVSEGNVTTIGPGSIGTRAVPVGDSIGPLRATHITWEVGTLEPGQAEQLYMRICTRLNPAGHQEFTSPGIYSLNDGAYTQGFDTSTGDWISAGPTLPIKVIIAQKPQRDIIIIGEFPDETIELPRPPILPIRQNVI